HRIDVPDGAGLPDLVQPLKPAATTHVHSRADPVTRSIARQYKDVVLEVPPPVIRRCGMRRMVIDEDDLFPGHPHPEQVSQAPALPAPMVGGLDWRPLDQLVEFSTEGPPDRGADIVCPAIGFHELLARHGIGCIPAVHRHEVDLVQRIPPEVQDSLNRLGGHSGPVLHPTKAFLLDGRGQQAILIETRRRVVTVVDAEDLHVSTFTPLYLRTPWPTSRA